LYLLLFLGRYLFFFFVVIIVIAFRSWEAAIVLAHELSDGPAQGNQPADTTPTLDYGLHLTSGTAGGKCNCW
jgi:hypothetical protein